MESCSTCAQILSSPSECHAEEKPLPQDRRVECCSRVICGKCIHDNERFAHYCPYCQVSSVPSSLPQGLREPPAYESIPTTSKAAARFAAAATPPPYTSVIAPKEAVEDVQDEKAALAAQSQADREPAPDTLHFLNHELDTVTSLSFRYGVSASALRRANNITSDHLLAGRRTVIVPGAYYKGGVSLSPRPVEGEEEELRKAKIRRFMTSCKVPSYDVAVLYLKQSDYDLGAAVEAYSSDEQWERDHPRDAKNHPPHEGTNHKNRGPFWRGL